MGVLTRIGCCIILFYNGLIQRMPDANPPLLKGTLAVLILKALAWAPMHGFELAAGPSIVVPSPGPSVSSKRMPSIANVLAKIEKAVARFQTFALVILPASWSQRPFESLPVSVTDRPVTALHFGWSASNFATRSRRVGG